MSDQLITRAWVGGQWVTGRGGSFSVMDPATGDEIARVADCTVEDVTAAIGKGRSEDASAGCTITSAAKH